jgi:predicted ester cyclase
MPYQQQNQKNKEIIWDFWQKMNYIEASQIAPLLKSVCHPDLNWNGPHPLNHLEGIDALLTGFWHPLLSSFPDLKRKPYIFMGGFSGEEEWVSGVGYLTGTFVRDWLGIPATGEKTHIHFGQFYVMRDQKIVESYGIYDLLAVMRQAGYQVLPPARGAEGGKIPGPRAGDGLLLTVQDELETRKTRQLVDAMGKGLERYVRSRDGGNLRSMEQEHYWDPYMHWYGPSGIGQCLSLEEFEDFHQRPWLKGFGDRGRYDPGNGKIIGLADGQTLAEGLYSSLGIWDVPFSHHNGEYQGIPATGKLMTIRDFDWYRREGNTLVENWVPIDLVDLFMQMGVDLFERLRMQVELCKRGRNWLDADEWC